jgi:hypothetical protein
MAEPYALLRFVVSLLPRMLLCFVAARFELHASVML